MSPHGPLLTLGDERGYDRFQGLERTLACWLGEVAL